MDKWQFIPKLFNGEGETQQLGSIIAPNGFWFAAVESFCTHGGLTDFNLIQNVIKVLNKEMPNGKIRKHRKGKKCLY